MATETLAPWLHVKCTRTDGGSFVTSIRATEEGARAYYMGYRQEVLVWDHARNCEMEKLLAPVCRVDVLRNDEVRDAPT